MHTDKASLRGRHQHGRADHEQISRRAAHQTEGHAQRPPLRPRQPVHAVQEGNEQQMNGGKPRAISDSTATVRTICRPAARSTA
jgi:hypothetical protein